MEKLIVLSFCFCCLIPAIHTHYSESVRNEIAQCFEGCKVKNGYCFAKCWMAATKSEFSLRGSGDQIEKTETPDYHRPEFRPGGKDGPTETSYDDMMIFVWAVGLFAVGCLLYCVLACLWKCCKLSYIVAWKSWKGWKPVQKRASGI